MMINRSKRLIPAIVTVTLGAMLILTAAPSFSGDPLQEIRDIYAAVNKTIEEKKAQVILFYTSDKGWKEAKDPEQKEFKDIDEMDAFERNYVYLHDGRIIKVRMALETPSGDWMLVRDYYFYDNGRTAFVFDDLATFQGYVPDHDEIEGPYVVEKRVYFDAKGKQVKALKKAFVKATGQEISAEHVRQVGEDVEVLAEMRAFAFYRMLRKGLIRSNAP
ncbi:MAG TPA: hypothetical protein DCS42_07760 [Nitrospiraceae bacterium]|nr:hypothetical protein [Nitrospiraceae bacterium]